MPNTKFESFKNNYLALKKPAELLFSGKVTDETVWSEKRHEHVDSCEVVLVVHGSGQTYIDNVAYTFNRGDLLIYNERVIHSESLFSVTDPLALYYVVIRNFSLEGMEDNKLIPSGVSPVLGSAHEFQELKQLFEIILNECDNQDPGYEVVTNNLLNAMLIKVIRLINDQYQLIKSSNLTLETRIKSYIEKNYMDNLTLKDIARHFYISQYHLEHLFKQSYNDSPINYLIRYRLEKAKKLLETSDLSVKTIASMTGYDTISYFCVAFKKAMGVTPTEFRNSISNKSS